MRLAITFSKNSSFGHFYQDFGHKLGKKSGNPVQAHNCMLPKQWTCLLCSVSVISANKLSLQELTELIRIKLLISRSQKFLRPSPNFQGWECPFSPPGDAHVSNRLKFCWLKVTCCICQSNELEHESQQKNGGPSRGSAKARLPLRTATG